MPRIRVGVVILLPEPLATEVDGLRRALGDALLERIPPHITLVPPVNVREDRLSEALGVLRAAAAATHPFVIDLGPASTFWPDTPVVKLTVGGDGLADLGRLRERIFVEPFARPLTWPFVPHVTLVDGAEPARITDIVATIGWTGSFLVESVHLLEEGDGRRWTHRADAPLRPPSIVGRGGIEVALTASTHPERGVAPLEGLPVPFACTARRHGAVVGVATGSTLGATAHLHHLVVAVGERGFGVGVRLLDAVGALAADLGCDEVTATAPDGAAARFLRGHGYAGSPAAEVLHRRL